MENNLFIAYDLDKPGQNYPAVFAAIKTLGAWVKIQKSLYYVQSKHTAEKAAEIVWESMDGNDKLTVVDALNNIYWAYDQDHLVPDAVISLWVNR